MNKLKISIEAVQDQFMYCVLLGRRNAEISQEDIQEWQESYKFLCSINIDEIRKNVKFTRQDGSEDLCYSWDKEETDSWSPWQTTYVEYGDLGIYY